MLSIYPGMKRESLGTMDQLAFDNYDKNGDGVISHSEYANFLSLSNVGKANKTEKEKTKGFDVEQFDPQGSINFESNGGFNAKKLNIIA